MEYSLRFQDALCVSGIKGLGVDRWVGLEGSVYIKAEEEVTVAVGRYRKSCDCHTTPSFLQALQLSGGFQKPCFSIFDHGCIIPVSANLHHLMLHLSTNRVGWDGIVFVSYHCSYCMHLSFYSCTVPATLLGPVCAAHRIHFTLDILQIFTLNTWTT